MVLAKDETLVKEWEYGKSSSGKFFKEETSYSLTVTDKRIVAASKSSRKNSREEISLSDVKGVSATHSTPSQLAAIIQIASGIALFILSIVFLVIQDADLSGLGILMLPFAFIFFISGMNNLNQGSITLSITTNGPKTVALSLGFTKLFRNFSKKIMKLTINNEVAEEIVETIGSLLLGN